MAGVPVETIEPDPSATSIGNDQTVTGDAANMPDSAQEATELNDVKKSNDGLGEDVNDVLAEIRAGEKEATPAGKADATPAVGEKAVAADETANAEKTTASTENVDGAEKSNAGQEKGVSDAKREQSKSQNNKDRQNKRSQPYNKRSNRENVKTDYSSQQETDDPVQIRKQVSF